MANGTIAFDTLTTSDSVNTGTEKSIDTSYLLNGSCKAWNFFDGGITAAAAKQEAVNAQIAEVRFADLRNQIRLEVEQAYKNLLANAKNIETATIALQQAEKALELVSFGYSQDASTQLEVNTAQNELTQAAGNRVRAITNYNRSLALLQRAINQL